MTDIILIEDDDALREGMKEYIEVSGFSVCAVSKGIEFFEAILKNKFDIAVVDLGLPDISGQQLINYLHQHCKTSIIVLTSNNSLENRVECYQLGADLFMSKPVNAKELIAVINRLALRTMKQLLVMSESELGCWRLKCREWVLLDPCGVSIQFTAKEFTFFEQLADESGMFVTREQLCINLYGRHDASAEASLCTLVRRVRKKIAAATSSHFPILMAHNQGYRFPMPVVLN